jgi:hypothetical protein
MQDLIDHSFKQWTQGRSPLGARINIYRKIRDLHYAIVAELNDLENYVKILEYGKGSCMPKHFLLCNMFQRLGLQVLYSVTPFRWDQAHMDYPEKLLKLAAELPQSYHIACRVDIDSEFILVDATLDPALKKLGLPVNEDWDGMHETISPMVPCGEEQLFHPAEISLTKAEPREKYNLFYDELNRFLEQARQT